MTLGAVAILWFQLVLPLIVAGTIAELPTGNSNIK
jgi:hypothetical protein